ncbi:hypothetical protein ACFYON_04920 [Micromonospora sp. NPDC005686]|uniref:hypothetical protein n=1 Tax=unclassified Micromonospora TaxID=2617518 RepID=UPI0033B6964D
MTITGTQRHPGAPSPADESFIAFPLVSAAAPNACEVAESDAGQNLPGSDLRGRGRWWAAR